MNFNECEIKMSYLAGLGTGVIDNREVVSLGVGIIGLGSWILDHGFWIMGLGSWVWDHGFGSLAEYFNI